MQSDTVLWQSVPESRLPSTRPGTGWWPADTIGPESFGVAGLRSKHIHDVMDLTTDPPDRDPTTQFAGSKM